MAHPIIEKAVYKTKYWQKFRAGYFAAHNGMCERCPNPGVVLHHIEELTLENYTNPAIVYGDDNLMLLCWSCHEKTKTKGGLPVRADVGFDADGNVVPTGKRLPGRAGAGCPP